MTRAVAGCPWIPLDSTWTEPETKLSAARRSSLRRARRHAENIGIVEWEFCPSDRMTLARGLEEAFRIESAGWKGRTGTALLNDERRRAFYESYVEMAASVGTARLCLLKIAGKAVAMQVAVECADRFWLLKVGYDEAYSKCSPGNLLMLETIRYAARQGFKSYEFLGTDEPWTSNWTEHVRPCVSLLAYPINVPGMAALAGDAVRVGLDRIRRHRNK
jgi:CelD/BcsL family acetyltransferase involved in cellulose biosynthesis